MSLAALAYGAYDRLPVPDFVTRRAVDLLVGQTRAKLARTPHESSAAFARAMGERPIAEHTDAANAQHYEIPDAFFGLVLGPRRKYSSCLYASETSTLAEAEETALAETVAHADLADGQRILELGCGWGSLTLWMAEHFPAAKITAVSNSASQRAYIEETAAQRGFSNVRVITADMNVFEPQGTFDRVVSVEMFEHMANWRALLTRVRSWLEPDGRLFLHVFTHRAAPYRFETADPSDWIAQHFFTGGIMPSHQLAHQFGDLFAVEADWRWSGAHYQRTAEDWLTNFDARRPEVRAVLAPVYGAATPMWERRWRAFFLATAGLFGHAGGSEWGISHYRMRRA
jgi:cyclopropane-fatty-acyl-phospholipid synthase